MADAVETIVGLGRIEGLYAVVLCDVFGVLHDATEIRPAAVAALRTFRAGGGTVVLVSNSSEPGPRLAETLRSRGVAPGYDALVTAADIARILLDEQASERVHHIGPARVGLIRRHGLVKQVDEREQIGLVLLKHPL